MATAYQRCVKRRARAARRLSRAGFKRIQRACSRSHGSRRSRGRGRSTSRRRSRRRYR